MSRSAGQLETRPAWDTVRPVSRLRAVFVVLAVLALVPALGATALRVFPPSDDRAALIASFIPYGLVGYLVALLCLAVVVITSRRRAAALVVFALVCALTGLHASWLAPFFVADSRPATTSSFTVMSLNLYGGNADSRQVWAQAQQADIVVLVELTEAAQLRLKALGWDERFPYAVGNLADGISDTGVYSRFPISDPTLIRTSFQQWLTTVTVPEVGPVTLVGVHACNPYCGNNRWESEHQLLNDIAARHLDGPLVMAGDFNAIDDHGPMQDLRRLGLRSATDVVGAGWMPTWPARHGVPLIPIDHVMIDDQLTATSISAFPVSGTDHLGLFATLAGA